METPAPVQRQSTDNEHLKLLSIFHYVLSGLSAFFACIPIIHVIVGLAFILMPRKLGQSNQPPPALFGWIFVFLGSFFILAGWTFAIFVLVAGRFMAHRKHYTFCLVMAGVECLFMPFGTVLGVFTILVLNRQTVKELFTPVLNSGRGVS
jgi:hypothetical protein